MSQGDSVLLAKALSHPLRVEILMKMNTPRRRISPREFSDENATNLSNTSYHFRRLADYGFIELVGERPVRGSTEHFYEPVVRAMAWTKQWELLAPALKQNLATTALHGFVEAAGASIDAGTFDQREDSHLSWDTMRVDEEGWRTVTELLNSTLEKLLRVEAECAKRMGEAETGFMMSYVLSAFEAPPSEGGE
ncbi:MAG TPA: helix-turn-helix domain-containing protein [Solirubrobacterales bacterium]